MHELMLVMRGDGTKVKQNAFLAPQMPRFTQAVLLNPKSETLTPRSENRFTNLDEVKLVMRGDGDSPPRTLEEVSASVL